MRRKWLIVAAAALPLLLAGLFQLGRSELAWDPRIRLRFVGFHTNAATAQTNAHFDVEGDIDWPVEVAWFVREVSHRQGESWVPWDPHTLGGVNIDWLHTSNGVDILVPVETVVAPSRIVIELKQRRAGVTGMWDDVRSFWASFTGGDTTGRWQGPSSRITNETVPLAPKQSPLRQ